MQALFDLNGTLFDPAVMAEPIGGGRRAEELVEAIFGDAIELAMVETMTGSYRDFAELIEAAAARRLAAAGRADRLPEVTGAARRMRPFPDASRAIELLREAGHGVGVLTNSSTETARDLIAACDLDLDPVIGTDRVRAFKPDPRVYARAVEVTGEAPRDIVLITAHWWDALGAKRAGLGAAWIARKEGVRLAADPAPDHQGSDLAEVAQVIVSATDG
jgi:2-haloacid dehalogenase